MLISPWHVDQLTASCTASTMLAKTHPHSSSDSAWQGVRSLCSGDVALCDGRTCTGLSVPRYLRTTHIWITTCSS